MAIVWLLRRPEMTSVLIGASCPEQIEDDVSLQRRILQGKVDILRAERERRQGGGPSLGLDDLGPILGGGS